MPRWIETLPLKDLIIPASSGSAATACVPMITHVAKKSRVHREQAFTMSISNTNKKNGALRMYQITRVSVCESHCLCVVFCQAGRIQMSPSMGK
jgi:hypothetical protein